MPPQGTDYFAAARSGLFRPSCREDRLAVARNRLIAVTRSRLSCRREERDECRRKEQAILPRRGAGCFGVVRRGLMVASWCRLPNG